MKSESKKFAHFFSGFTVRTVGNGIKSVRHTGFLSKNVLKSSAKIINFTDFILMCLFSLVTLCG
jgi:hypothetical protein